MFYPAGIESRRGGTPASAGRNFFSKISSALHTIYTRLASKVTTSSTWAPSVKRVLLINSGMLINVSK